MVAKKVVRPSPSPEEFRQQLLAVLQALPEPVTAAALLKKLPKEVRLPEPAAQEVFEQEIQRGSLFSYPAKSAAGQPRYWTRHPVDVLRSAVDAALSSPFDQPFTLKDLLKKLRIPVKATEDQLQSVLEEKVHAGRLHQFPAATARGGPRYWDRSPVEFGRHVILKLVRASGPQPEAGLKKALKGYSADQIADVLKAMSAQRELFRHPAHGKIKKELWGAAPPSPAPYLKDLSAQLKKLVQLLKESEVSDQDLRRSLIEMSESAGVSMSGSTPAQPSLSSQGDIDLVQLIHRLEPGASQGALVAARDLRRLSGMQKSSFDDLVLRLARTQELALHRHDYPASLSESEREDLVHDGAGNYYVGIALRGARQRS
ncbi:hypothetical protein SH661x_001446 [Planctomicrobium sp. SH661]|uniref:hypothetical protein n=1 Tax=Planctomicrobium sp. SH661 TaxID=3448124 RepID=UPI003F5CB319